MNMGERVKWTIVCAAIVLALAAFLFWSGWFCGSSSNGRAIAEVKDDIAVAAQSVQSHMDARLDKIEGKLDGMDAKLDAILRIATNPPPDMRGAR
jgi:type VI protein secretion system component VasK